MKKALLVLFIFSISISCDKDCPTGPIAAVCSGPITIGSQTWMCKNLDVVVYRNGDTIPEVKYFKGWSNLKTGAWCYYNNDPARGAIYGKLYNWYAVNDPRGLAPEGWHVPSDSEWKELELFLGMTQSAVDSIGPRGTNQGGKLKENSSSFWYCPNTGATNESGFTALPGGYRSGSGEFDGGAGGSSSWWSSTVDISYYAWERILSHDFGGIYRYGNDMTYFHSVRCIKDN